MNQKLFPMGQLLLTNTVKETVPFSTVLHVLERHALGDWGDCCEEDKQYNDRSVVEQHRILSSYKFPEYTLWVITEWDRSATTVLFPDEY